MSVYRTIGPLVSCCSSYDMVFSDAPVHVVEPMPGSNNDNRQDQNEPTSHMNGEMPHQEGSGSGGQRGPRGDLNNTGSEKMCVLMDSDDRSTGSYTSAELLNILYTAAVV